VGECSVSILSFQDLIILQAQSLNHPLLYISVIYTPNLELGVAVPGREREHGRFRGSMKGALREHWGSTWRSSNRGSRILFGLLMYIGYNYFADNAYYSTKAVAQTQPPPSNISR